MTETSQSPQNTGVNFGQLLSMVPADADNRYDVRHRGRPQRSADVSLEVNRRRDAFGLLLRDLRTSRKMTLATAAGRCGFTSARKLAQYEGRCYPPGAILAALSQAYSVDSTWLSKMLIAHTDPDLFAACFGQGADDFISRNKIPPNVTPKKKGRKDA